MPNQIQPNDPVGTNWVTLGEWMQAWATAAGATFPTSDPLLSLIEASDTEGVKFAKWQRWLKAIRQSHP